MVVYKPPAHPLILLPSLYFPWRNAHSPKRGALKNKSNVASCSLFQDKNNKEEVSRWPWPWVWPYFRWARSFFNQTFHIHSSICILAFYAVYADFPVSHLVCMQWPFGQCSCISYWNEDCYLTSFYQKSYASRVLGSSTSLIRNTLQFSELLKHFTCLRSVKCVWQVVDESEYNTTCVRGLWHFVCHKNGSRHAETAALGLIGAMQLCVCVCVCVCCISYGDTL